MPAVRHTPKRSRMTCPECGRDVAYTHPWDITSGLGPAMRRDYDRRLLSNHNNPSTKAPCSAAGGRGLYLPRSRP